MLSVSSGGQHSLTPSLPTSCCSRYCCSCRDNIAGQTQNAQTERDLEKKGFHATERRRKERARKGGEKGKRMRNKEQRSKERENLQIGRKSSGSNQLSTLVSSSGVSRANGGQDPRAGRGGAERRGAQVRSGQVRCPPTGEGKKKEERR
ncbi:hypothetical protein Mapa_013245 [Marchantia paleacea]|nr:hypothetical protein Mapa_013245 [Marchantia paleacea]